MVIVLAARQAVAPGRALEEGDGHVERHVHVPYEARRAQRQRRLDFADGAREGGSSAELAAEAVMEADGGAFDPFGRSSGVVVGQRGDGRVLPEIPLAPADEAEEGLPLPHEEHEEDSKQRRGDFHRRGQSPRHGHEGEEEAEEGGPFGMAGEGGCKRVARYGGDEGE